MTALYKPQIGAAELAEAQVLTDKLTIAARTFQTALNDVKDGGFDVEVSVVLGAFNTYDVRARTLLKLGGSHELMAAEHRLGVERT